MNSSEILSRDISHSEAHNWDIKLQLGIMCLLPVAMLCSIAATEALSWLFFTLCLYSFVRRTKMTRSGLVAQLSTLKTGAEVPLWGFIAISMLSLVMNVEDSAEIRDVAGSYRWIFLLYAYSYFFGSHLKESWKRYVPVISFFVCALSVYAVLQFFFGFEPPRSRSISFPRYGHWQAVGFFNMPLTFAGVIGYYSFLLFGFSFSGRQFTSFLFNGSHRLGTAMGWISIVVSMTRGAWIAFIGAIVLAAGFVRLRYAAIAMALILVLGGAAYWKNEGVRKRVNSIFETNQRSNNLRWLIWAANIEMIKDHPVLGVGTEQNNEFLYEYYPKLGAPDETFRGHAHNNFLQVWAGQGSVALIFYLWFCGLFLWWSLQIFKTAGEGTLLKAIGLGGLAAQLYFHLSGMTECNFIDGEVNHILVFSWGLILAARARLEKVS